MTVLSRTIRTSMVVTLVVIAVIGLVACAEDGRSAGGGEVKQFELAAKSSTLNIGDGVTFEGFTFNDTMPGPQKLVQQGDTVEVTVHNEDSVTHGLSMHAVNGQTSNFLGNIQPGETATLEFEADDPGVFMYHCAPGGHGIMAHTMGGQHGMFVVEPDVKVFMVQHEVYSNGRDFFDGNAQDVMFNGETFRYVRNPINVRPDGFLRDRVTGAG